MDEIIYLEPDEEITSVADKIKRVKARSIALVVPRGSTILQSVVNLKLLKREAEALGQQISLVTTDKIGRNLAAQVGLSVYENVESPQPVTQPSRVPPKSDEVIELDLAEKKEPAVKVYHFQGEKKETPPPKQEIKLVRKTRLNLNKSVKYIIIGLVIILLALAAAYFFVPKAIATLTLKTQPIEKTAKIVVDQNIKKSDLEKGTIQGILYEVTKESSNKFPATGQKNVGEKAHGNMTVYNETGVDQTLPAGTQFKAKAGLVFILDKLAVIPKATLNPAGDKVAGSTTSTVTASEPGDQYNIGAQDYSVSGQTKIYGRGDEMKGGLTRQIKVVSVQDIENAKNNLIEDVKNKSYEEIKKEAKDKEVLKEATQVDVVNERSSKKEGEEAEDFDMTVKGTAKILTYDKNDFNGAVETQAGKDIPEDKKLIFNSENDIKINVDEVNNETKTMNLTVNINGKLAPKFDEAGIKNNLAAKSREQAESFLSSLPDVEGAKIELKPSWWLKKIPSLKRGIIINFEYK